MGFTLERTGRRYNGLPPETTYPSKRMLITHGERALTEHDPSSGKSATFLVDLEAGYVLDNSGNLYLRRVREVVGQGKFSQLEEDARNGVRSIHTIDDVIIETATSLPDYIREATVSNF